MAIGRTLIARIHRDRSIHREAGCHQRKYPKRIPRRNVFCQRPHRTPTVQRPGTHSSQWLAKTIGLLLTIPRIAGPMTSTSGFWCACVSIFRLKNNAKITKMSFSFNHNRPTHQPRECAKCGGIPMAPRTASMQTEMRIWTMSWCRSVKWIVPKNRMTNYLIRPIEMVASPAVNRYMNSWILCGKWIHTLFSFPNRSVTVAVIKCKPLPYCFGSHGTTNKFSVTSLHSVVTPSSMEMWHLSMWPGENANKRICVESAHQTEDRKKINKSLRLNALKGT